MITGLMMSRISVKLFVHFWSKPKLLYILQQCCFFLFLPTYEVKDQLGCFGNNNIGGLRYSLRCFAIVFFGFTAIWREHHP